MVPELETEVVISTPIKRQWFEPELNCSAAVVLGVEITAILEAFDGLTLFPDAGKLAAALDSTTIHPELLVQEVEGTVKFPL
jgi:hypothetical protein